MAKQTRAVARRRRHRRVRKKVFGTPDRPRLNVFRSLKNVSVQVIDDEQGHTVAAASTLDTDRRPRLNGLSKTEQARVGGHAVEPNCPTA